MIIFTTSSVRGSWSRLPDGILPTDFNFNRKAVVSLRYDGVFSASAWFENKIHKLGIFSVGAPHDETIGLPGIPSWVECKTGRSVVSVAGGN